MILLEDYINEKEVRYHTTPVAYETFIIINALTRSLASVVIVNPHTQHLVVRVSETVLCTSLAFLFSMSYSILSASAQALRMAVLCK